MRADVVVLIYNSFSYGIYTKVVYIYIYIQSQTACYKFITSVLKYVLFNISIQFLSLSADISKMQTSKTGDMATFIS